MAQWSADNKLIKDIKDSIRKDANVRRQLEEAIWSSDSNKSGQERIVKIKGKTYNVIPFDSAPTDIPLSSSTIVKILIYGSILILVLYYILKTFVLLA